MNILLSGASGFLGKHIGQYLGRDHSVIPFDISSGFDMTDKAVVHDAVLGKDLVLHFASAAVGRKNAESAPEAAHIEYTGTMNFAEACAASRVPLVYASSIRVYGSAEEMQDGEQAYRLSPNTVYGKTKLHCEEIIQKVAKEQDLRFVIMRMSAAFGPGMPHSFVLAIIIESLLLEGKVRLRSTGQQKRNFLYVEDIARAVESIIRWGFPSNEVFNIVHDDTMTLVRVAEMIGALSQRQCTIETGTEVDTLDEMVSNAKAKNILGWTPSVSMKDGFGRILATLNIQE